MTDPTPFAQQPPPLVLHHYPVVAAVREREHDDTWIVICRRTVTTHHTEAGPDAAHAIAMTVGQAMHELADRLGMRRVPAQPENGPAPAGHVRISGQLVNAHVDRPEPDYVRALLTCQPHGNAVGDGDLIVTRALGSTLSISLPDGWTAEDQTSAAAAIVAVAYHAQDNR